MDHDMVVVGAWIIKSAGGVGGSAVPAAGHSSPWVGADAQGEFRCQDGVRHDPELQDSPGCVQHAVDRQDQEMKDLSTNGRFQSVGSDVIPAHDSYRRSNKLTRTQAGLPSSSAQGAKVLETCLYLLSVLSIECYIVIGVILYGYIVIGGM
ncbi:uncharacterized protein LOC125541534 [Triticum urartu]|uniref:uncharacterized protein LOC125541534 n=1 Tax=Triticum urartu TaxID=4572 RepID=UPI002043D20E|nr:uncharacterized protein LOC125541534 [Triticum urartu]